MSTATILKNTSIAGIAIASSITRTADGQIAVETTLPVGQAGTLSTRTDDDTGVATLSGGHGIETADVVDVYWAGGVRYGMDATVATNDVTVNLGAGDNLPTQDTALVVTKQVTIATEFDGDDVKAIAMVSTKRTHVNFRDSGQVSLAAVELVANADWSWYSDLEIANPLTGNAVEDIKVSNGDSSATAAFQLGVLHDNVT